MCWFSFAASSVFEVDVVGAQQQLLLLLLLPSTSRLRCFSGRDGEGPSSSCQEIHRRSLLSVVVGDLIFLFFWLSRLVPHKLWYVATLVMSKSCWSTGDQLTPFDRARYFASWLCVWDFIAVCRGQTTAWHL